MLVEALVILSAWAIVGGCYFIWGTLENEYRWAREEAEWGPYFLAGPFIWLVFTLIYFVIGIYRFNRK